MASRPHARILHLEIEFPTWNLARSWSYAAGLGLDEGLDACNVEYLTVTTPWFSRLREICAGQRFDQVWLDVTRHAVLADDWLEYVASLAPVRVGFLPESMSYTPEEWPIQPEFKVRKQKTWNRLQYLTHAVATDERDAEEIAVFGGVPAMYWPQAVPSRYLVADCPPEIDGARAIFSGALYGKRADWMSDPLLAQLVQRLASSEAGTDIPGAFDLLHATLADRIARPTAVSEHDLTDYLSRLRELRRRSFQLWLNSLQSGCAVVNLPSVVKGFASRVMEAMAAGRPVVSWRIPDRPRTMALFAEDEEILTFSGDAPDELITQLQRVHADQVLRRRLAINALRKIRKFHTVEHRVAQILEFIRNGTQPVYA